MKRLAILFLMYATCHVVAFASTNTATAAVAPTNAACVAVRNPFWPIGYTGELARISAEVRPKPKPKPKSPKIEPRKDETASREGTAGKDAAAKAAAKAARPREITSADWRTAQKALKFGNPALFKAEDGTVRSSININGNIYVDGDLMSFNHDGVRYTWRIQGLDGKENKLKLKRVQARLAEQPKKTEQKKSGGGK